MDDITIRNELPSQYEPTSLDRAVATLDISREIFSKAKVQYLQQPNRLSSEDLTDALRDTETAFQAAIHVVLTGQGDISERVDIIATLKDRENGRADTSGEALDPGRLNEKHMKRDEFSLKIRNLLSQGINNNSLEKVITTDYNLELQADIAKLIRQAKLERNKRNIRYVRSVGEYALESAKIAAAVAIGAWLVRRKHS